MPFAEKEKKFSKNFKKGIDKGQSVGYNLGEHRDRHKAVNGEESPMGQHEEEQTSSISRNFPGA